MAKTVILTRPKGPYAGDEGLSKRLETEGFSIVHLSSLSVEALDLRPEDENAIRGFVQSSEVWLAFLSPTAVHVFRDHCVRLGIGLRDSLARLAAQGAGTSEAVRAIFHREVDLESPIALAEVFAEQLVHRLGGRGRVIVPQSAEGRDVFAPIVRQSGVEVVSIPTYGLVTVQPSEGDSAAVKALSADDSCLVFMSPSAVRSTVETFADPAHLKCLRVVSIGPVTSKAVRDAGLKVFVEAKEHTEEGVVECLRAEK
jgi:uroporphyrinogen III methyltransferase/synthase